MSATTALGVVTYAVLRFDYGLFYDRFGLKPEDVGLGQAELISQSVSGVVLILILFFLELVLLALTVGFLGVLGRETVRAFRDTRRRYGTLAAIQSVAVLIGVVLGQLVGATAAGPWLLVTVSPVALWFLWRIARGPVAGGILFGAFGLLVFVLSVAVSVSPRWTAVGFVGLLVLAALNKRWSSHKSRRAASRAGIETPSDISAAPDSPPPAGTPRGETSQVDLGARPQSGHQRLGPRVRVRRFVLVVVVAMTVALTEVILALSAVSDANFVRSGHVVEPTVLGLPILSWGARAVDVTWAGEPPAGLPTLLDHCLLYLGQGDGAVLLYDHDAGRTIRISSGAVVLSIHPATNYQRVCPR